MCALVPSVFWCVAIGNLHERCQRILFQALTQNIFRSVRLSVCTSAQLPSGSLSPVHVWNITALLTAVQKLASLSGWADFSWSRLLDRRHLIKSPAQTGGSRSEAAGEESLNSGSATQISCIIKRRRPYYYKCVSAFPAMLFQQVGKAGISLITVFKSRQDWGFSQELEDAMTFAGIHFWFRSELKVADPRKPLKSARIAVRRSPVFPFVLWWRRTEGNGCNWDYGREGCVHISDLAFVIPWIFLRRTDSTGRS